MSETKYARCEDCGSIHLRDSLPTASDPYTTDGTVEYCPDCREAENFAVLTITAVEDAYHKAWVAYFADSERRQASGFKAGRTKDEAINALKEAFLLSDD